MANFREVVIVSAVRTPIGTFGGTLSAVPAPRLGAIAIKEALQRAGVKPEQVDEVIMGNVLTAGEGQAPARQAAIYAGLPTSVACMTINKVCGSGLKAVMLAAQSVMLGDSDIVVAGGMENMSQVPYYLPKARWGYRMGNGEIIDGMVYDGLWDPYNNFHMGNAGEMCARECNIPREAQDEFAKLSYERALNSIEKGWFKEEIVPVPVKMKKDEVLVDEDEEPKKVKFEKIPNLRPAFEKDGTITAANASKINDGASALVVMAREKAEELGLKPLAKIIAYSTASKDPAWFTTAPADSIDKLLKKVGMTKDDVDLYEINEAFAVVTLAVNQILGIPVEKVNVAGGAVALGHPIGASGARILTTLLYNLKRENKEKGIASLCIGGGEAVAVLVEMM
ncbi:MAG: thiolase family protein [Methanobacteriota archaeon]|nr:MAG: thiolase family protein [Euryarchaeota archaeon]